MTTADPITDPHAVMSQLKHEPHSMRTDCMRPVPLMNRNAGSISRQKTHGADAALLFPHTADGNCCGGLMTHHRGVLVDPVDAAIALLLRRFLQRAHVGALP